MVQNNTKFKQSEIGEIPENWKVDSMCNICNVVTDYVANGSFASLKKHVKYSDIPDFAILIRLSDFNNGFRNNFVYVNKNGYEYLKKTKLFGKEIIISNVGAYSGTTFLTPILKQPMTLGPNSIMIKTKYNDNFYYYWLTSSLGQSSINDIKSGSAVPKFNKTDFKKIKAPIPPIDEQKQIASILSSLDDKIELNQKTIKTLEEIGQTLFKRWFIDFEFPNEKGEPYKSSGGEMINSELGEIPKGWSIGTVKDIATIKSGFAFKGDDLKKQGDFGIVKIKNVNDGVVNIQDTEYISESTSKKATNFKLSFGDVLIAMSGNTTGKIGIMPKTDLTFYLNQRVGKYFIKDKKEVLKGFLYFYITRPDIKQNTIEKAYGSAQPNISPSILESCEIVIPPTNEFETIFNFFNQIIFEISEKTYEIVKTSNLRDSLLPKLLSGKIRIN